MNTCDPYGLYLVIFVLWMLGAYLYFRYVGAGRTRINTRCWWSVAWYRRFVIILIWPFFVIRILLQDVIV